MNGQIDRLDRHAVKMIKYVDMSMNLFFIKDILLRILLRYSVIPFKHTVLLNVLFEKSGDRTV